MDGCLQHQNVAERRDLYDLRYFYDDNSIGQYTCGVAFETMVSIFRQYRLDRFCGQEWYSAVERSPDNPVVQGYLAEHICLSSIVANGLSAVNTQLRRMSHASFQGRPNWDALLKSDYELCLYTPRPYNFKAVDGVILLLCHSTKQAHMYPIQFTLSMRHKKSDKDFYTEMWRSWAKPIEDAGFTLESTFVWIDKKQPSDQIEPARVRKLKSQEIIVHPEYRVTHVGVEQVDPRLARSLGL
jgi:hypothetical protein